MSKRIRLSGFLQFVLSGLVLTSFLLGAAPVSAQTIREVLVTTTADSGEGSLREALQNQRPGTVIRFDTAVFPVDAPATIFLETPLPNLTTGRVTIDGSDAGVIIDGSLLGNEPELAYVDDVTLSFDGGPNILENGDFNPEAQLNHWSIWQDIDVENFVWSEEDGAQDPGSMEWRGTSRQSYFTMIYDMEDTATNNSGINRQVAEFSETSFLPLNGAQEVELRFWYRYGNLEARLGFMGPNGGWDRVFESYEFAEFWDQAVLRVDVPDGADRMLIDLTIYPTQHPHGLMISSSANVIQGLQVINFPGSAIEINDGSGNVIGGPNLWMADGCAGACNLLSGNVESGLMISRGGDNIVQGNYIGTNISGTEEMKNGIAGVRIFDSRENQIGGSFSQGEGNLLSGNSIAIEINAENEGSAADGNIIQGNLIGTDPSGTSSVYNQTGIGLGGSSYTRIGGDDPDLRNIISGNEIGISMNDGAHHNTVLGNFIGTDITGLRSLRNDYVGVEMIDGAYSNQVGGTEAGEANVLSGNDVAGVLLRDFESHDNLVTGNLIGIGADGETPVGNVMTGVTIENTTNNQIGPGNRIANNGAEGVIVQIESAENGNTITQNSITNNDGPGIFVYVAEGDAATMVEEVMVSKRSVTGAAPAGTRLEFYQDAEDEGETYLGATEADDKGRFSWAAPVGVLLSENITVLTADSTGTTGGFSKPVSIPAALLAEIPGLPGPEQVSVETEVLLLNSGIALAALLFFGVVATWFNESLENFSDEIAMRIQAILVKWKLKRNTAKSDVKSTPLWETLLKWAVILGITAFIQTFLDPVTGFDRSWWGQLFTLILSGFLVTGLQILSEWLLRRLSATHTDVKETEVSVIGLVMASLSVIFSRIMHFSPGVVLGTVDGLYCNPQLDDPRQDGQRALAAKGAIFGLTLIGWLISPLFDGAPGIQSLLITMFIMGVQYAFFELIPLKVLDGYAVRAWDKWIWRLSFFISLLGFVYLCINPDMSDIGAFRENSLLTLGIMAGALLLISFGLKVYTDHLMQKESNEQAVEAGE